jgi:hypothetical protein
VDLQKGCKRGNRCVARFFYVISVGPYRISCVLVASFNHFYCQQGSIGLEDSNCSPPFWLPHNSTLDSLSLDEGDASTQTGLVPSRGLSFLLCDGVLGAELLTKIPGGCRRKLGGR